MGGSQREEETIAVSFEQAAGSSGDLAALEALMQIFDEVAEEATTRGITPEGLRATVATDTVGEPSGAPPAGSSIAEGEVVATVALGISQTFAVVSADLGPARDVLSGASPRDPRGRGTNVGWRCSGRRRRGGLEL